MSNFFFSGQDLRRDVVYTSILDGLPPGETGLLCDLLELSSGDLVGPVRLKGFLDFPEADQVVVLGVSLHGLVSIVEQHVAPLSSDTGVSKDGGRHLLDFLLGMKKRGYGRERSVR